MSYIELRKQNLLYNFDVCATQAGGKDHLAVVLKDNAYGHGLLEIATIASEYGIQKAVVQTYAEAALIEEFFQAILILADTKIESYSHRFHITINTLEDIDTLPIGANIHIKVDTGMHRNGIDPNQVEVAICRALERNLTICGVFTHHKAADELGSDFFYQNTLFWAVKENVKKICEKLKLPDILFHSCNSAALFRHQNFTESFARIGIATYGYLEGDSALRFPELKPVMALYGEKISTRVLKKGQKVGYGGTYTADADMVISTYDIGYGDGFRRLGGRGATTQDGKKILGRVSMDNIVIEGDDRIVCIFDDVSRFAKLHGTITYEILTAQGTHIPRRIV